MLSNDDIRREVARAENRYQNTDSGDGKDIHYSLAAHQVLALWVIAETLATLRENFAMVIDGAASLSVKDGR